MNERACCKMLQHALQLVKNSHLPLPLGEVAERSEVGEGLPIFCENRENRIFALQIFDNPLSHADA